MKLLPFQNRFMKAVISPKIDTAVLSIPRGNGKSWLAAYILATMMRQHWRHVEFLLCAASIEQARSTVFNFIEEILEQLDPEGHYRVINSATRLGITYPKTNTRLRVLSSKAKTAMGIVRCPLLVADEPGSWEVVGGELMHDAIQTAQGKPGSRLKVIYIGTMWPSHAGWWPELIEAGSHGSTYVQVLKGDPKKWDKASEIRRTNPLKWCFPDSRAKLFEQRNDARKHARKKARFLSANLNLPTRDETDVLLTVGDWENIIARSVAPRGEEPPIVGVDLGGRRAWSAACAIWPSTRRVEAFAAMGGEESVADREKMDLVTKGTYQRLIQRRALFVAEGKRVPPVSMIVEEAFRRWGKVAVFIADYFRLEKLEEEVEWRALLEPRRWRWSEATSDIEDMQALAVDGDLTVATDSRRILEFSIAQAVVKEDDANNVRLVKKDKQTQRDDVAAAFVLACGGIRRHPPLTPLKVF